MQRHTFPGFHPRAIVLSKFQAEGSEAVLCHAVNSRYTESRTLEAVRRRSKSHKAPQKTGREPGNPGRQHTE